MENITQIVENYRFLLVCIPFDCSHAFWFILFHYKYSMLVCKYIYIYIYIQAGMQLPSESASNIFHLQNLLEIFENDGSKETEEICTIFAFDKMGLLCILYSSLVFLFHIGNHYILLFYIIFKYLVGRMASDRYAYVFNSIYGICQLCCRNYPFCIYSV